MSTTAVARGPGSGAPAQTDVVVEGIKAMIVSGLLVPGARLPRERDLAEQLQVSRGSLREGVRALCIMGVLETRQGDGTFVTALNASLLLAPIGFLFDLRAEDDAAHLHAVRRVLETEAAGLASQHMDSSDIESAAAVLAAVDPATPTGDSSYDRFLEADIAFHRIIARSAGNPVLDALIDALATRTVRGRMWRAITEEGALETTHREHLAILRAIADRDHEAARIRMGSHLLAVQEFVHQSLGHASRQT